MHTTTPEAHQSAPPDAYPDGEHRIEQYIAAIEEGPADNAPPEVWAAWEARRQALAGALGVTPPGCDLGAGRPFVVRVSGYGVYAVFLAGPSAGNKVHYSWVHGATLHPRAEDTAALIAFLAACGEAPLMRPPMSECLAAIGRRVEALGGVVLALRMEPRASWDGDRFDIVAVGKVLWKRTGDDNTSDGAGTGTGTEYIAHACTARSTRGGNGTEGHLHGGFYCHEYSDAWRAAGFGGGAL